MSLGRSLDIRIINLYDKKVPIDGIVFSYIINAIAYFGCNISKVMTNNQPVINDYIKELLEYMDL